MRKYRIGAIICFIIFLFSTENNILELVIPAVVLLWYCAYKLARYERTN